MLDSVLIANRGEIACRIIRTARRLGMRTIAVYSEADADALFVQMADEAHLHRPGPGARQLSANRRDYRGCQGNEPPPSIPATASCRNGPNSRMPAQANGIVFVGPPASAIRAMGLKDAAKTLVQQAGVPVVPGYHGARQDPDFLRQKAYEIGYPVLIKAVAGGGGKGMRRVEQVADFDAALESAQREAASAFGDRARAGREIHPVATPYRDPGLCRCAWQRACICFERDCSLQRRHQKVIEEAPGARHDARDARRHGQAAVEAARAVGYVGAGTVEFIADGREGLRADRFYFMEMNTRLQVEHPVTEAITGLDLVELQFRVASGEPLPLVRTISRSTVMRLRRGSTPRIPSRSSCPRPASSGRWTFRRAKASGSTRACEPATR